MRRLSSSLLALFVSAVSTFAFQSSSAAISVSGGITVNGATQPFLFTWNTPLPVTGTGWAPGESVSISLLGPLTSPGVSVGNMALGSASADSQGNFTAAPVIPYDSGVVGPQARIPRPGLYQVLAAGAASGVVAAADFINLCPDTYTGSAAFDWGHERGGRDGVLPGNFRAFSPERFDPEWVTVWDELPVEVYATVVPNPADGNHQPALISTTDAPPTHYGHDSNTFLTPDPYYQWLIGTSNYVAGDPDSAELGHLEVEWEDLNGGSTSTYQQGNIGLPMWAKPAVGDRVYLVGRWILDAGHPEVGDRTEIHPPRLVASMRQRPALASSGAAALRVDLYASGHGGGANRMPIGLSTTLNQGGYGGGRIRDALSSQDQDLYYRAGPVSAIVSALLNFFLNQLGVGPLTGDVFPSAGPSAFPWGGAGPEMRNVNDMDYDFDIPLPPPPPGASTVNVDVVTQPQHSTAVTEVVTFTNPVNGLPTTAHVHLPYHGADNGIYARTLLFSWDTAAPPPLHFQVSLNRVNVIDTSGRWQLWSEISGQWSYLTALAPALQQTRNGQTVMLPQNQADVWLGASDSLRIFIQGYRANCLDDSFGKLFGMSSYDAGLSFLQKCGPTDNDDLGSAVLELQSPVAPGNYTIPAIDSAGDSHFSVDVSVNQGQ